MKKNRTWIISGGDKKYKFRIKFKFNKWSLIYFLFFNRKNYPNLDVRLKVWTKQK